MQLFFTKNINGELATLEAEEARHVVQVLRKREGAILNFVDGVGGWYEGEIISVSKKECVLRIQKKHETYKKRTVHLHIAIAPTKNIARLEWFLEKATEMGIDEITPLLCRRSERKKIRTDRLEKILLAAMKQSGKAYLPKLNELTDFQSFINKNNTLSNQKRFIAYCNDESLNYLKKEYVSGEDVTILIGPEGDFSPEEIELAKTNGVKGISLGDTRLRTETAGIAAVHTINFMNM